jgi:precorrin-8X/cobalt-precorrin-8 methylmutase
MREIRIEYMEPKDIEARSMEIISKEIGDRALDPKEAPIIKRVIHTTADFDYLDNLNFTDGAVELLQDALKKGASIVTDTQMAKAGINKKRLGQYGGEVHCFMSDPDVAAEARERGVTRAFVSMEKAARMMEPFIFAIGNAPTALIRLHELMLEERISPIGIIGVPVGFVNVVEAKELILDDPVTSIVARGRKGGSNVAAAIVNALLYSM